jgi:hypothetical protein
MSKQTTHTAVRMPSHNPPIDVYARAFPFNMFDPSRNTGDSRFDIREAPIVYVYLSSVAVRGHNVCTHANRLHSKA